jgi:ligand-binding SRPBCC domain-containing protein
MSDFVLRASLTVPLARQQVFAFFADARNLGRITPPELRFEIVSPPMAMQAGTLIDYRIRLFGIPLGWRTEITRWDPPNEFEDVQLFGPYAAWVHRHTFRDAGQGTLIEDVVRYRLPFGIVGRLAHPIVRLQLRRIFSYRQRAVEQLLIARG